MIMNLKEYIQLKKKNLKTQEVPAFQSQGWYGKKYNT